MLRLARALEKGTIAAMTDAYRFAHGDMVEKFVMDFELQSHIADRLDCVTRGGLCMSFYAGGAGRMSLDVDLATALPVEAVDAAMRGAGWMPEEISLEPHEPKKPYPLKNLVSYKAFFDSCFGNRAHVKVDFFCDAEIAMGSRTVKAGYRVLDFATPADMRILTHGWLLGDKLTALALGTVGLRSKRQIEVAKQVYDVGMLIRGSTMNDIAEAFDAFPKLTAMKADKFDNGRYSPGEITADIAESVGRMLDLGNAVTITRADAKNHSDFAGTFVSKTKPYKKTDHITNVLLVLLLAGHMRDHMEGKTSAGDAAASVYGAARDAGLIDGAAANPESPFRTDSPETAPRRAKILRAAASEHALLVRATDFARS